MPLGAFPRLRFGRLGKARATGNLSFDAQIAAVCREHGVSRLVTRDRDFSRFPWIEIVDLEEDPAEYV
jgi:predicted nucleic acid-binding protein